MVDDFVKIVGRLDLDNMHGLEIGALFRPRIESSTANVQYLDHLSTEDLRDKYRNDPNVSDHLDQIVKVDFVAKPGTPLRQAVGPEASFDFVIASHLIEHVPDTARWLQEVEEILRPSGYLCLVIPDLRYTFDARRQATTPAQVIDAYLRSVSLPTFQQAFDFHYENTPEISAVDLWDEAIDLTALRRHGLGAPVLALGRCEHVRDTGDYEDIHCTTFTPASFVEILEVLARLDLTEFELVDLYPTEHYSLEFFATLQKSAAGPERIDRQLTAVAHARQLIASHEAQLAPLRGTQGSFQVSAAERRLLEMKRRALFTFRRALGRLRPMGRRRP